MVLHKVCKQRKAMTLFDQQGTFPNHFYGNSVCVEGGGVEEEEKEEEENEGEEEEEGEEKEEKEEEKEFN